MGPGREVHSVGCFIVSRMILVNIGENGLQPDISGINQLGLNVFLFFSHFPQVCHLLQGRCSLCYMLQHLDVNYNKECFTRTVRDWEMRIGDRVERPCRFHLVNISTLCPVWMLNWAHQTLRLEQHLPCYLEDDPAVVNAAAEWESSAQPMQVSGRVASR
jgi:hypothetical protein